MFGLFHSTSISEIMVIGSKKNNLAADKLNALNLEAGWPSQPSHACSGTRKRRAQDGDGDEDEEVPSVGVTEEARQRANAQARFSSSSNHAGVARQASSRLQQTRADEIKRVKRIAAYLGGSISAADRSRLTELGVRS
ncbi:130516a8-f063-4dfc-b6cd-4adb3f381861 [Sclerotinia trifoliorum]|uniref:130516a8-f063-4dfc-b6cd-4adb3f381861 n=1 Tax=Sclerotinia trifoliorum TaxID=28548 RepID=A0A8H2VR88_9HELO|nr:130516a8-f063-4dfc-b6cd-4adb3f381861 [Sclerotinia trifoliorum]